MDATRATEQSQDPRGQYARLDNHYGKIGISAVAAAVRHKSQPNWQATRQTPHDSD